MEMDINKMSGKKTLAEKLKYGSNINPVLGLQKIFAFENDGNYYYICALCGDHGETEVMYKHIKGNRHNDKYIRLRTVVKSAHITPEERFQSLKTIFKEESFSLSSIHYIKGGEFYPYPWENERRSKFLKLRNDGSAPQRVGRDLDYLGNGSDRIKYMKTESGRVRVFPSTTDKMTQSYSPSFVNYLLNNLWEIVNAFRNGDTELRCWKDMKTAIFIIKYALHLLHFVYKNPNCVTPHKKIVDAQLYYMNKHLLPCFEKAFGEI